MNSTAIQQLEKSQRHGVNSQYSWWCDFLQNVCSNLSNFWQWPPLQLHCRYRTPVVVQKWTNVAPPSSEGRQSIISQMMGSSYQFFACGSRSSSSSGGPLPLLGVKNLLTPKVPVKFSCLALMIVSIYDLQRCGAAVFFHYNKIKFCALVHVIHATHAIVMICSCSITHSW